MSMKKSDLDKMLGKKIGGQVAPPGAAGRFGQDAAPTDRREQRRIDAAAGLVSFACKLPSDLAATLRERGAEHADGLNGAVAELLRKGLDK